MQPNEIGLTDKDRARISAEAKQMMREVRTALILDEPFFGVLAMKLLLVEDWEAETWWVDGVHLGYNPVFTVVEIGPLERKGVMLHEVFHCALKHPWRREDRDPEDWNGACDEAINPMVKAAGYLLPPGVLLTPAYAGQSAEWIYEQMYRKKQQQGGGKQQSDKQDQQQGQPQAGNGQGAQQQPGQQPQQGQQPSKGKQQSGSQQPQNGQQQGNQPQSGQGTSQPGQPGQGQASAGGTSQRKSWGELRDAPADVDPKQLDQEWTIVVEQAARAAMQAGKCPGFVKELVEQNRQPQVDWKEILWGFVQNSFYSPDYRYTRPHQNFIHLGLYMPSLVGEQMPPMIDAKDSSASITADQTAMFNAELKSIIETMNPESVWELIFDTRVTSARELMPGDELTTEAVGRGGTDVRSVFKWVDDNGVQPVCAIIKTDLDTPYPTMAPDYPVLWVCPPGVRKKPPFGTKVEIPYVYPKH